ncbi:MAG: hypothetical protein HDR30_04085 [Lachnospiraceae bacterium]|nr:hypothetical protein [Lachnospiraceae bacterium]
MKNKIRINKRVFMLLAFGILLCAVCIGRAGMSVRAKEQTFIIDAKMLPSTQSAYEVQIKVENQGQDWEGTVRLGMRRNYGSYGRFNGCAYDTELSLPQGSTKQFVVRVPKDSINQTDGVVRVTLLDKNGGKAAQKEFGRLLQTEVDALTMGILSDDYMSLTYLDMGGNEFYYNSKNYPIKLEELNQDKLSDSLGALSFLVIDSYNTGVLSDRALEDIRKWLDNGGVLIIGTGENAEEVLAGFDDLGIQCVKINEPGENTDDFSDYVDISQLHMAELRDVSGNFKERYDILNMVCSRGDGAVEILPYSLSEVSQMNAAGDYEQQKDLAKNILQQAGNYASSIYGLDDYAYDYYNDYMFEEMCCYLGNGSTHLKLGGLKWIVILYVIFVGPVLYLILRSVKKRDFYWIAVPVTTLVGIFLVYWAGRGFEVVDTHVYSVTIENLDGGGNARTYLRCYDAGHKEWDLRLAEGYEYAGPFEDSFNRDKDEDYYYRIRKEGDRLYFGMNPSGGFEDGLFQAGGVREPEDGSIYGDLQYSGQQGFYGTVSNETKWDFKYFAVYMGEDLYVYKNLPAGAEVKLEEAEVIYNNDYGYSSYWGGMAGYYYRLEDEAQGGKWEKDVDALTALGIGITYAYPVENPKTTVIVGVIEDWNKAVDDVCSEVSYGCLYAFQ